MFSIGVKPEIKLAKEAGIICNRGIITNEKLETSDPDIYAIGDAIEVKDIVSGEPAVIPLAGPANKQGRIVADQITGRSNTIYKGTLGTGIAKIFDMTAASCGLNERMLKLKKIPYLESITHSGSHAGYYPNAYVLAVKILFSPNDGKLLGG